MVGPSPVTSNGTDATEIEDEVSENVHESELSPPNTSASASSHATAGAGSAVSAGSISNGTLLISIIVEETQYFPPRTSTFLCR